MIDPYIFITAQELSYTEEEQYLKKVLGTTVVNRLEKYNAFLAGGALTSLFSNKPINDFDMFFETEKELNDCQKDFSGSWGILKSITPSSQLNAFTYKIHSTFLKKDIIVQLIKLPSQITTPSKVLQNFDFTVCQAGYSFGKRKFLFDPEFFKHLSQRKLVISSTATSLLTSLIRIEKYKKKGFTISNNELMQLTLRLSTIKFATMKEAGEQMKGLYLSKESKLIKELTEDESEFDLGKLLSKLRYHSIPEFAQPNEDDLPF